MRTLYFVDSCEFPDDDIGIEAYDMVGEMQFFLDENFKVIASWSNNDANYRHEYMGDLLRQLGADVVHGDEQAIAAAMADAVAY